MKAVIDRFEGNFAIVFLGDTEEKQDVPRMLIPKKAVEGSWLQVELQDGMIIKAVLDPEETARMKAAIEEKLKILRSGEYLKDDTDKFV